MEDGRGWYRLEVSSIDIDDPIANVYNQDYIVWRPWIGLQLCIGDWTFKKWQALY